MKAPLFAYAAPRSVDEAVALLADHGDDCKVLAGGQSFVPVLAMRLSRPGVIVDVNRVEGLSDVERMEDSLRIGTLVRHAVIEHDERVAEALPLLTRVAPYIGHFQIRNRGTFGGSLAHADSAAEWPAVAIALDAEFEVHNAQGVRTVPASEFFVSTFMTALESEDLLTAVRLPLWGGQTGYAVRELARRSGDFAIAGVVCAVKIGGGVVERLGIAMLGMGATAIRLVDFEKELVGQDPMSVDLAALAAHVVDGLETPSDIHASGAYRRRVAVGLVAGAVASAVTEALGE